MMTSKLPVISIITPTYNRADELKYLFKSLNQQSVDPKVFEFIISDDGSTDSTKTMVESWIKESEILVKFITQKNQGPGAARNRGMKIAQGDLLLFIDCLTLSNKSAISFISFNFSLNRFCIIGFVLYLGGLFSFFFIFSFLY